MNISCYLPYFAASGFEFRLCIGYNVWKPKLLSRRLNVSVTVPCMTIATETDLSARLQVAAVHPTASVLRDVTPRSPLDRVMLSAWIDAGYQAFYHLRHSRRAESLSTRGDRLGDTRCHMPKEKPK